MEREKKRRIAVFYELPKREIVGKRAAVLGWYLASIKNCPFAFKFIIPGETDIIVYGTFAVPSRITRTSVFSGDRPHATCAV